MFNIVGARHRRYLTFVGMHCTSGNGADKEIVVKSRWEFSRVSCGNSYLTEITRNMRKNHFISRYILYSTQLIQVLYIQKFQSIVWELSMKTGIKVHMQYTLFHSSANYNSTAASIPSSITWLIWSVVYYFIGNNLWYFSVDVVLFTVKHSCMVL